MGLGYTTFMTSVMIVLQAIVPQHLLSRAIGKLAGLSKPVWLKNMLVRAFMRRYDIGCLAVVSSGGWRPESAG